MKYIPYPMWLEPEGVAPFIVKNKEEHDAYLASLKKVVKKKAVKRGPK